MERNDFIEYDNNKYGIIESYFSNYPLMTIITSDGKLKVIDVTRVKRVIQGEKGEIE